ncbi:MAG: hypothetical protein KJ067_20940 [Vicinamibacteria bacterium]|nr:hypothetical protein [Vicinamibacteria bacterium]
MRIRTGVVAVLLGAACAGGCGREREKRIEAVSRDAEVLSRVNALVNQVVRAAGDCDAVRASLPEARQRLNEAGGQVREEGSRQVLITLREQLDRAAEACP